MNNDTYSGALALEIKNGKQSALAAHNTDRQLVMLAQECQKSRPTKTAALNLFNALIKSGENDAMHNLRNLSGVDRWAQPVLNRTRRIKAALRYLLNNGETIHNGSRNAIEKQVKAHREAAAAIRKAEQVADDAIAPSQQQAEAATSTRELQPHEHHAAHVGPTLAPDVDVPEAPSNEDLARRHIAEALKLVDVETVLQMLSEESDKLHALVTAAA